MKHQQSIKFETPEKFYDAIYALTVKGLTFEAYDADASMCGTYLIVLTGGY
jgi:hypothetical protein